MTPPLLPPRTADADRLLAGTRQWLADSVPNWRPLDGRRLWIAGPRPGFGSEVVATAPWQCSCDTPEPPGHACRHLVLAAAQGAAPPGWGEAGLWAEIGALAHRRRGGATRGHEDPLTVSQLQNHVAALCAPASVVALHRGWLLTQPALTPAMLQRLARDGDREMPEYGLLHGLLRHPLAADRSLGLQRLVVERLCAVPAHDLPRWATAFALLDGAEAIPLAERILALVADRDPAGASPAQPLAAWAFQVLHGAGAPVSLPLMAALTGSSDQRLREMGLRLAALGRPTPRIR